MRLYVYAPILKPGTVELIGGLGATRLRQFDGMDFWAKGRRVEIEEGAIIVNWGGFLPEMEGTHVVNHLDPVSEFDQFEQLKRTLMTTYLKDGASKPSSYGVSWFPRVRGHSFSEDIISPPTRVDYWTAKADFVREYRVHTFQGRAIKGGERVPLDGFLAAQSHASWVSGQVHPWLRSVVGGWRVSYEDDALTGKKGVKLLAANALLVLGLTFGMVDVGERTDGHLIITKVTRAPSLEGKLIPIYMRAINRYVKTWLAGEIPATPEPSTGPSDSEDGDGA